MTDENFRPEDHMIGGDHYFEDLVIDQKFPIPSRTMTDALFAAFQLASGEYCRARGHQNMLAHGFQALIQTAPGAGTFPYFIGDSLIGFIEQSSRFLKPVYAGDTVYPMLTVIELKPQNTTGVVTLSSTIHNQRRELLLEGEQKFLLKKRSAETS
ncbi:MaoC family dehydratase [Alphaproteobacteria bacterium]|nr:MaoC family dehydratase [Alphaproteobacteria bacterium]